MEGIEDRDGVEGVEGRDRIGDGGDRGVRQIEMDGIEVKGGVDDRKRWRG